MKNTYTIFEKIQRITLSFTLLVTSLVILVFLWQLNLSIQIKFIIELVIAIFLFVFSLFIIVINEIPKSLPRKFDVIKNKIANNEIQNITDFANELNTFLIQFFNYITFDIDFAATYIKDNPIIFSSEELKSIQDKLEAEQEKSRNQTTPIKLGKTIINDKEYVGYILPMHFGNQWLGYFAVFSKTRLNKIYIDFLNNFEDDYVDDQLIHVLQKNK